MGGWFRVGEPVLTQWRHEASTTIYIKPAAISIDTEMSDGDSETIQSSIQRRPLRLAASDPTFCTEFLHRDTETSPLSLARSAR